MCGVPKRCARPDSVLPQLAADSAGLVAVLPRLLDAARSYGARVVHATYEGTLSAVDIQARHALWRTLGPLTASWRPGSHETQVLPQLLASTDLILPRHHGLFPTLDSELLPVLKGLGVQTVVLAGVSLNLALPTTAGHVTQAGFNLVVPRDVVGGTPTEYGNQVLDNSIAVLGRITTADALIEEWAADH